MKIGYLRVFVLLLGLVLALNMVSAVTGYYNYDYYGLNPDDNHYVFNAGHINTYAESYTARYAVDYSREYFNNREEVYTLRPNKHYISNSFTRDNPWNGGNPGRNGDSNYNQYGMVYVYWPDEGYPNDYYYQPRFDSDLGYYNWRY